MFVANEAKLLQSLEGKCRNNTAKVIYLKLKLASSFFPISLREISTMTSGLAEKINRRGSVEISLSFPLSIAIYWLILGLLRSIRKSPRLMALGEECSSLPWPPVWSSVGHSWGSCSSAQQQLLRWWKLWFTTVHPLQWEGGGPCWSLNTFCPKTRAERVRNISVHNAGNRKPRKCSDCRVWFLKHPFPSFLWPPLSGCIQPAQPAALQQVGDSARWVLAPSRAVQLQLKCNALQVERSVELRAHGWMYGAQQLSQSLPLPHASTWTAGVIDFAKSIAIFINHL